MARDDPAAARQAADSLPIPADRHLALGGLAASMAARDPAAALEILSLISWTERFAGNWNHLLVQGEFSAGPDPVGSMMLAAPEPFMSALAALPADQMAPVNEAMGHWAGKDPEAASRWLQAQPPGPARDQALTGLHRWLLDQAEPDFAAALAWASAAAPDRQSDLRRNTISKWLDRDPAATRAAVDQLVLAEDERTSLLGYFPEEYRNAPPVSP